MSVCLITGSDIPIIKEKIDELWNTRNGYHMVYVSIGSQYNESHVQFNTPSKIQNKQFVTNASQQMIPHFLRYRSEEQNILIIAIDYYRTDQKIYTNRVLLEKHMDDNMDIIMINQYCSQTFLEEFIGMLFTKIKHHNIDSNNVMICNYVKHLNNPNALEERTETMIPTTIQNILDHPHFSQYSKCFYEWFGYRFYLYNFIYNYKNCRMAFSGYNFINELETFMKCQYDDNMKSTAVVQNVNTIRFWESIYDITTMTTVGKRGIATNLTEYLIENGQMEQLIY